MATAPDPGSKSDLQNVINNHLGVMRRQVRESKDPDKRPPVPPDFMARELCRVKPSGSNTVWTAYTVAAAEQRFTADNPEWDKDLVVCPPGELFHDKKIKVYACARDIEEKYGNRPSKEWKHKVDVGNYTRRIGEMGEQVVSLALQREAKGRPGLLLSGFRLVDNLAKEGTNEDKDMVDPTLQKVGVPAMVGPNNQSTKLGGTEFDMGAWMPSGDYMDVIFTEVKVIQEPTPKNVEKKVGEASKQNEKNFRAMLALFPDIDAAMASQLRVRTFVALPTVNRPADGGSDQVLYREDLNPMAVDHGSLAKNLEADIMQQTAIKPGGALAVKLGIANPLPPSQGMLDLLKKIASRYTGIGSLHPMKQYKTFFKHLIGKLQQVDRAMKNPATTDQALHLDLVQAGMAHKKDVMVTGTYGVGKTAILEAIGDRIENSTLTVIFWQKSYQLKKRFNDRFVTADVMDGEEACQKFGVTMDLDDPTSSLSKICAGLAAAHPDQPPHLLVDEFPCKGDLSKLQTHGVITALAVQPATYTGSSLAPVVAAPAGMRLLVLNRVFRYTHCIGAFLAAAVQEWEEASYGRHLSTVLGLEAPGHQLHGEIPECLLLPMCSCSNVCYDPAQHLLQDQWTVLQALLDRLVREGVADRVTLMVDTRQKAAECQQWLQRKLAGQPELANQPVVTVEQFRGLEADILLWIGDSARTTMLDSCTRVTGRLLLVSLSVTGGPGTIPGTMLPTMKAACEKGRARWAPEQKMVGGPPPPTADGDADSGPPAP
jgi:hypothetical protein